MEAVGARLGRSSTRYGPATVFTGPTRKWKKKWVDVSPSNSGSSNSNNHSQNHHSGNDISNGNNGSHLVLFKWTPISQSQNNNDGNNDPSKDDAVAAPEEPPRRKFKYIPIAVLEEQKKEAENEAAENIDDEAKLNEADPSAAEPTSRNDGFDEKPDINDLPMDGSQEDNKVVQQDLNESALDLSLGLIANDGESDSKTNRDGQLERLKSSSGGT